MILTGKKPSELDSSTLKSLRENIAAYKIFTALLTQVGTDDPIVTVLENTLGGTLSFTRISDGDIYYIITGTTGMFSGSTYGVSGFVHNTDNTNAYVEIRKIDDDICRLYVQDIDSSVGTDLHSSDYPIEIRVYSTIMPSPTPSIIPSVTPTISESPTPSISETPSITPTISETSSVTPTISESPTPSISEIPSITPSVTPTISETPSISVTPSISETPSITPTVSPT